MSMMMLECASDSILSKRKCESEFAEVEEVTKKKATGGAKEKEKEDEKVGGVGAGEKGKEKVGRACGICSEGDHNVHCCPWRVCVPQACKYCQTDSDELKPCAITGFSCSKRVCRKACGYCLKIGHVDKDCKFYMIEFDPFNPPPGIAPVLGYLNSTDHNGKTS